MNTEFIKIDNSDVFSFQNIEIIKYISIEESINKCIENNYTGFVVFDNKVYFRNNCFEECIYNIKLNLKSSYTILLIPEQYKKYIFSENERIEYYCIGIFNEKIKVNYKGKTLNDLKNNLIDLKKNETLLKFHKFINVEYLNSEITNPCHYKFNHYAHLYDYINNTDISNNFRFDYAFCDMTTSFSKPKFVQSRVINNPDKSIIIPLMEMWFMCNRVKEIINDIKFEDKMDGIVWRGTNSGDNINSLLRTQRAQRITLVEKFYNKKDIFNIGFTDMRYNQKSKLNNDLLKPRLSFAEQLKYKFILALEGNDIATNLAFVLLSNSVPIIPQCYMEDWYMQGKLKEWTHYVPVKNDFSDLEDNYNKCLMDIKLCKNIILNSKLFALQFLNIKKELKIIKKIIEIYNINVIFNE